MNASYSPFPLVDVSLPSGVSPSLSWMPFPLLTNITGPFPQIATRVMLPPLPAHGDEGSGACSDFSAIPDSTVDGTRQQAFASPFTVATPNVPVVHDASAPQRDYTDEDLVTALTPLLEGSLHHIINHSGALMETQWEPWLRMTMRRVLAEHRALAEPVPEAGWLTRLYWRFSAHLSGREYQDYLADQHPYFRIEQVFLLSQDDGHLLAHACVDESRWGHSSVVMAQAAKLAEMMRDADGTIRLQFRLAEGRRAELRAGRAACLIAVTTGVFPDALRADLDFTLRRIEERYGKRFADRNAALVAKIKPMLMDCLLMADPAVGDE